jgi:hypothetical protein
VSETSRFWSGTSPGDSGPYSSTQFQQFLQYAAGLGASRPNVGVVLGSGTQPSPALNVKAQGPATTSIDVLPGSALVQGIAYINTATVSFAIAANSSGSDRIDTVVLRADYALQTVRLAVSQGTPAGSPVPPTLTQSANILWEIPIADIAVANGFTSITNANITPRHEYVNAANGVYLDNVLNNSGGTLEDGNVVIWDTSADRAVTTTTTQDNRLLAGVWRGRTANGSYGRVQKSGIGYVLANGATTRGNLLATYTTAKQAVQITTGIKNGVIGKALETTTGTGLVLTHINVKTITGLPYVRMLDSKTSGTAAASLTLGAWRTRELTTEETDTDNLASLAANQITLQPGRWMAWAAAQLVAAAGENRIRLQNITAGATLLQGNNASASGATGAGITSIFGVFDIAVASVIELQHYPNATGTGGRVVTTGEAEIFAQVDLIRIGEFAT